MKVIIYSDGSCIGRFGSYCGLIQYNGIEKWVLNTVDNTTNNRMELTAVIESVKFCENILFENIHVFTDSRYVEMGLTQWIFKWLENDWKSSTGKNVLNRDLWQSLFVLYQQTNLNISWVPAHSDNHFNNLVDKKAREILEERIAKIKS